MGKPGSDDARRIARMGAVDLERASLSDRQALDLQATVELKMGMRCHGCGRRVSKGVHVTAIDVRDPERAVMEMVACSRRDCDFRSVVTRGATVSRRVEFSWHDPFGADAPAVAAIALRNARAREAAAAD